MSQIPMTAWRMTVRRAMVAIAVLAIISYALFFSEGPRYRRASERMRVALESVQARRPPDVPLPVWNEAVGATRTVCVNVCAGPSHINLVEFERFCAELERKLEGPVDLDTLDWIVARLARTGDHGERYMQRIGMEHYEMSVQGLRALRQTKRSGASAGGWPGQSLRAPVRSVSAEPPNLALQRTRPAAAAFSQAKVSLGGPVR